MPRESIKVIWHSEATLLNYRSLQLSRALAIREQLDSVLDCSDLREECIPKAALLLRIRQRRWSRDNAADKTRAADVCLQFMCTFWRVENARESQRLPCNCSCLSRDSLELVIQRAPVHKRSANDLRERTLKSVASLPVANNTVHSSRVPQLLLYLYNQPILIARSCS